MAEMLQYNLFGPPEPVESYASLPKKGRMDDAPVPSERELLWPSDLVEVLGVAVLEKLYGDIPRRTRLKTKEVCRRLRWDSNTPVRRIREGSLDGTNTGPDDGEISSWKIYRYSIVSWLFNREFVLDRTRGCAGLLNDEEMDRLDRAIQARVKRKRKQQ